MLGASFTGCVEDEEDKPSSLEDAFNDLFDSITNDENHRELCKYTEFTVDEENNTIILANNAELDECAEDDSGGGDDEQIKITVSDYSEENLDYKPANNSGSLYLVSATIKVCNREDNSEPWDCDSDLLDMDWVKVGGQWLWWDSGFLEQGESAPIATFFVEEDSNNVYHVDVIKVSKQEDLTGFSFFLKDVSGSTYVGGNGFGEIAMQIINGEEHGIQVNYEGDDEQLKSRADNVSNDDGSEFPVHFSDNDRDGKLSAGDKFLVYGKEAGGPAEDGWKLDIQFDATGDIIGSAKML
jgi:hypothetical protein